MIEKEIKLEGVDPREFYGVGGVNWDEIVRLSPKVKAIARGSVVKVLGQKEEVERFERRLGALTEYVKKYRHISKEVVGQTFGGGGSAEVSPDADAILFGVGGQAIRARTKNQKKLVEACEKSDLMFAVGPAGSGKTYTAIALAVKALKDKSVKRIILTRPAVEAGEKLGFLPGDMKEKLDPYLQPLYDALGDMVPGGQLAKYLEEGTVQIAPLAFMRGRTLDNAFVILDEAQNATLGQVKMFLTRMGPSAKFVVTGDLTQIDLPRHSDSGLSRAMGMLGRIKGISIIEFDSKDIIRHRLVKEIVKAFDDNERSDNKDRF